MSDASGQYEIGVRPFPGPGPWWPVSSGGGIAPRWRHDGRELYYIAPDSALITVPITYQGDTLQAGVPVRLFQTRIAGGGRAQPPTFEYAVARDGRFLINVELEGASPSAITLLLNWNAKP